MLLSSEKKWEERGYILYSWKYKKPFSWQTTGQCPVFIVVVGGGGFIQGTNFGKQLKYLLFFGHREGIWAWKFRQRLRACPVITEFHIAAVGMSEILTWSSEVEPRGRGWRYWPAGVAVIGLASPVLLWKNTWEKQLRGRKMSFSLCFPWVVSWPHYYEPEHHSKGLVVGQATYFITAKRQRCRKGLGTRYPFWGILHDMPCLVMSSHLAILSTMNS